MKNTSFLAFKRVLQGFWLVFLFMSCSVTTAKKWSEVRDPGVFAKSEFKTVVHYNLYLKPDEVFKQEVLKRIEGTNYLKIRWHAAQRIGEEYISFAVVYYWPEGEERDTALTGDDLVGRWVGISTYDNKLEVKTTLAFMYGMETLNQLEGMVELDPEGQDYFAIIKGIRFKEGILKCCFYAVYQNIDYGNIDIILYVTKEKMQGTWECKAAEVGGKVKLEKWVRSLSKAIPCDGIR